MKDIPAQSEVRCPKCGSWLLQNNDGSFFCINAVGPLATCSYSNPEHTPFNPEPAGTIQGSSTTISGELIPFDTPSVNEVPTAASQAIVDEIMQGRKWPGRLAFEIEQDTATLDIFRINVFREGGVTPVLTAQINAAELRSGPQTRDLPEEDMAARQAVASQVCHEICELVMKNATLGLVFRAEERKI